MRYAKIHKKWTENYGMMNPNLNFLVQIVINKYRGGNERSATATCKRPTIMDWDTFQPAVVWISPGQSSFKRMMVGG